jgi:stage V sporulation protein B
MSETSKKQTFLHGAALLAIATAVVKVIGAFYKLPLNAVIGEEGYAYFTTAYDIYAVLLMISTAGLPVAMSRMISQAASLGQYNQVRRIYSTARAIFLGLGIVSTLVMLAGCRWLADVLNQPDAWAAIASLAPCALLMGVISAYRGFFQGQGNMRPTSNSQMMEAVFKLLIGLSLAFVINRITGNVALAAGGAILGVTASCLVSAFYLQGKFRPGYRELPRSGEQARSYGDTAKALLAIAVPITIGSAGLQLLTVIESGLYMDRLVYLIGSNQYMGHMVTGEVDAQKAATILKGIYNMGQTIFNMPCSFIVPIAISVIPAITASLTLKKDGAVRSTEESAARITGLLSLPCTVGLVVLAEPIMGLLGGYSGERLALGGQLLALLGVSVFLYAIIQYTNALLQSHSYAHVPVINMLLCGVAKLAVVYILVGNPAIGILGAPVGAVLGYGGIAVLNLISIRYLVPQKPALLKNLLRPLLPAVLMGVAVYFSYQGLLRFLGPETSRVILCGGPIAVGVVVYFAGVVLFKAITREDCQLLPKGEQIAKLLRL